MKIETDIIISINVHEKPHFLMKQLNNISSFLNSKYYIILNCNNYMYDELKKIELPQNVIINDEIINKNVYHGSLTKGIYSNILYALVNFEFKHFVILSSRNFFYNKLDVNILEQRQKRFSDISETTKREKIIVDYNDWHWGKFIYSRIMQYYLNNGLDLISSCHEGLCFHYNVCENIVNFLDNQNHKSIKDDLFNFPYCVEEFALQSIATYEINPENLYYGFTIISHGSMTHNEVPSNPNLFLYKTIRI